MSGEEKSGFTFWWKIENFSMLPHQNGEFLASPRFVVDPWKEIEWFLLLFPRGLKNTKDGEGYISLYFGKTMPGMELEGTFSLTFESTDEIIIKPIKKISKNGWGCSQYISLKDFHAKKHMFAPQDILTLRFHLQLPDKTSTQVLEPMPICESESTSNVVRKSCTFHSGIQIQKRSITWTIKSFNTRTDRVDTYLSDVDNDLPNLKVSLLFREIKNNLCVPIEIQQTSLVEKSERLNVKCRITVVSNNEQYRDSEESTHLFELDLEDVWCFPLFVKNDNLTRDKYLDADETLQLQFDFVYTNKDAIYHWDTNNTKYSSFESKSKPQVSEEWCKSLQSMFATLELSDVTIETGGEAFLSYRSVLSAQSTVFRAMFQNDMKEKTSGLVEIKDTDPKVIKKMLTYLHSGVLDKELSPEDAGDLYRAAEKYNIMPLKQICSATLLSSLCVDSVCDVLVLADAHKDHLLWAAACNFVQSHTTETLKSDHWTDFMADNPDLTIKVMYLVLTKENQPSLPRKMVEISPNVLK